MTGKLMFVPDVDVLANIIRSINGNHSLGAGALAEAIIAAIDKPPVLRWEGKHLLLGDTIVSSMLGGYGEFFLAVMGNHVDVFNSEQEARRAAEKALGFPDGLIIEDV